MEGAKKLLNFQVKRTQVKPAVLGFLKENPMRKSALNTSRPEEQEAILLQYQLSKNVPGPLPPPVILRVQKQSYKVGVEGLCLELGTGADRRLHPRYTLHSAPL